MIGNLLAQSAHYKIIGEFEIVKLKRWGKRTTIIGDFYGDPIGALIDWQEQWCIMYGAGIIVYFLRPPFQEYSYHQSTPQWVEYHRRRYDLWFITTAQQVNSNQVVFTADPNSNVAGLYSLDIQHLKKNPIEKIENAGL